MTGNGCAKAIAHRYTYIAKLGEYLTSLQCGFQGVLDHMCTQHNRVLATRRRTVPNVPDAHLSRCHLGQPHCQTICGT
jgi:hypothetical protein